MPSVDGTTNQYLTINTQRMPDFTASAQYNWNANSHLKLAAIVRSMTYSSSVDNKAFKSRIRPSGFDFLQRNSKWQVYGQVNYGKGIGQYLNDLSNLNVDIVPNPEKEGRMQTLPMLGWFAGLQYNISKTSLYRALTVCHVFIRNIPIRATRPDMYRKGQYLVANLFWNVTSNLQVGAEYLGLAHRLQQQYPPCQPYECIGTIFVLTFINLSEL